MATFLRIINGLKSLRSSGAALPGALEDSVGQSQARLPPAYLAASKPTNQDAGAFGKKEFRPVWQHPFGRTRFYGAQATIDIPVKPKRPLTPYFRFLNQVREQVRKENPTIKQTELMKLVAQRWDELDDSNKERYVVSYKNELETYGSIIEKYNASLTNEQKQNIQQVKEDKLAKKERREKRQRIKELGKPKRPPSAFLQFLQSKVASGLPSEEYLNAAKHWGSKWKTMSEADKVPFLTQYKKDLEQYQKVLTKWEDKMIKQGNDDLVRQRPSSKAVGSKSKQTN